jgi:hypothetical protein
VKNLNMHVALFNIILHLSSVACLVYALLSLFFGGTPHILF